MAANGDGENFILHKVKPGETVSELALRYNVPAHLIAGWNDLKDISRIRAGQQLALYIRTEDDALAASVPGDTNRTVTERSASDAADMEKGRKRGQSVAAGPSDDEPGREMMHYRVRRGDSLWTIAREFDSSVEEIRSWNNLDDDVIYPDTELLVAVQSQTISDHDYEQEEKGVYYQVRGGDSLWTIARKFKQSMELIRKWNNLKDDVIHPGRLLLVKLADVGV